MYVITDRANMEFMCLYIIVTAPPGGHAQGGK